MAISENIFYVLRITFFFSWCHGFFIMKIEGIKARMHKLMHNINRKKKGFEGGGAKLVHNINRKKGVWGGGGGGRGSENRLML